MTLPASSTVWFVGAGPGNPDLLTIRAREILSRTRMCVCDPQVLPGVRGVVASELAVLQDKLDEAERDYERLVQQAKEQGSRRRPPRPEPPSAADIVDVLEASTPADIVEMLAERLSQGADVVRLVAGNPLSSERIQSEIEAVQAAGMNFQIVPGMSVPSTVPAFAGIALGSTYTETDISSIPADVLATDDALWDGLVGAPQPLVLQVVSAQLPVISEQLLNRGVGSAVPVSVTVNGTTRLQRTFDTTLGMLGNVDAADAPVLATSPPMVVTIGKSVDERFKYAWWENRALYGWRVLVPRAKEQAGPMSTRLSAHGAIPMEVPTISVEPPRNPAQMERAIKGIVEGRYQWIVLTSVNAVRSLWAKMQEFGLDSRSFAGVRIAAVGAKTAEAIEALGITPELLPKPTQQNSAGLVDVFPEFDPDLDPVGRVLLPRADIATDVLVDGIHALGWEVDDVVSYRTVRAAPPSAEVREMIKSGGFDAVCFTSASTVRNLVGIAGKPHARTIIACIGPMAAAAATELGLRVDVQPEVAGVAELVDALADHVAHLRAAGQLPPPRKKRRARKAGS